MIAAVTPTVLAALHRLRAGLEPLEPHPELGTAANWLYLVTGGSPNRPAHPRRSSST